jgi:RNA 2',3'-cyclic 3'-phosphodiesterase
MTGIRCFVAVELPAAMREEIGGLNSRIATEGLRLVKPELVHITIKFLGDVPQEKVGPVAEALGKIRVAPFPVQVKGMGAFPGRTVRVVWLGLEGDFQELYRKVESALEPLGFSPEARGFSPHVTLGRAARPSAEMNRLLLAKIASFVDRDMGCFTVDRFCLKKSTLTRGGPIYENLAEFHL